VLHYEFICNTKNTGVSRQSRFAAKERNSELHGIHDSRNQLTRVIYDRITNWTPHLDAFLCREFTFIAPLKITTITTTLIIHIVPPPELDIKAYHIQLHISSVLITHCYTIHYSNSLALILESNSNRHHTNHCKQHILSSYSTHDNHT
jgi:hypothetical protein